MTESKVDEMRRQFEAEMRKVGYLFTRDGDDYLETSMQFAWVGFQAALQSPVIGELVDASNELLTDMKIAQVNMRNAARHEPRGMNADARKALGRVLLECDPKHVDELVTVVFALRDQEADIARLNSAWDSAYRQAMLNGESAQIQRARAEKADALLREVLPLLHPEQDEHARVTAHLGAEQ